MALVDALLQEPAPLNFWIAARTDGVIGSGTASDPFNATTQKSGSIVITTLTRGGTAPYDFEATATTATEHGLQNGDVVMIAGATSNSDAWNGVFAIYGKTDSTFKYFMRVRPSPSAAGILTMACLSFPFDALMRQAPANIRVHIGPGTFQTRGFAANDDRGWQPKTGQNIVGAGFDVTVLQLVGADRADEHYHVVGTPITPPVGATSRIEPLKSFQISNLTIDCNVDNQPGRPDPGYGNVACGAVRILGTGCRLHDLKVINWGTKSLQQGCFVLSIIQASAQPSHAFGYPLLTETQHNGIEDCIAVQPSKNNARETTVLHIGGVKNATNHAQGFGLAAYIRKNFVDAQHFTTVGSGRPNTSPFPSHFVTSRNGTLITSDTGIFIGKRPHFRNDLDERSYVRFYNPKEPLSRWNGYFKIVPIAADQLSVVLGTAPPGTTDDSSFVVMGTEFRGIAVSSSICAVVEQNQIHNCWIGGPYQSPMDAEAEYDPEVPPTLAREERLDILNALHIRSLIVRDNFYRNVAVGPYFNAGGKVHYYSQVDLSIYPHPFDISIPYPFYIFNAPGRLWLWRGAPFVGEWKCDQYPNPPVILTLAHEVEAVDAPNSREFYLAMPPEFASYPDVTFTASAANRNYWRVFGTDHLVIESNQIWLADLDKTEFALKDYPLAVTPSAQKYRPYGIIVADNELSPGYAHRQVFVRNNRFRYVDSLSGPTDGLALQVQGIAAVTVAENLIDVIPAEGSPLQIEDCTNTTLFNNHDPTGRPFDIEADRYPAQLALPANDAMASACFAK